MLCATAAAAGTNTGFDQFGYNSNARLFNGWYGYYDKVIDDTGPIDGTSDAWLTMKWSKDWTPMADEPVGAWCTNHWTWYTDNVYDYGWDVSGDWIISVNTGAYLHDYTFTMTSASDGTFTGVGNYPASGTIQFDEVVIGGQITGNTITFTASYYNPTTHVATGYSWTATGTISEDGTMAGTGTSGVANWATISGQATKTQLLGINGWYGFEERATWDTKGTIPDTKYMVTEFMKIMKVGDDYAMWQNYQAGGAFDAGWGIYPSGCPMYVVFQDTIEIFETKAWNVAGNYVINFEYLGQYYPHDAVLSQVGNTVTGSGGNPAGTTPYSYAWTITSGSVTGNTITLTMDYTVGAVGTTMHMTGIINSDGSISGTWDDNNGGGLRTGFWSTTSGAANVGNLVDSFDLCTTSPQGLGHRIF